MRAAALIVVEVALLAVAHAAGGPAWAAIAAVACLAHVAIDLRGGTLASALPALIWLAASRLTGNRELFFPYSMLLAASTLLAAPPSRRTAGVVASGCVVAAFLVARVAQEASGRVLAVELAAAVAVLAAVLAVREVMPSSACRWWLPAIASLMAYGCLAL